MSKTRNETITFRKHTMTNDWVVKSTSNTTLVMPGDVKSKKEVEEMVKTHRFTTFKFVEK